MCGRVVYLHVDFPSHIAKVCEKFVNAERIFLHEPCLFKRKTVASLKWWIVAGRCAAGKNWQRFSPEHVLHWDLEIRWCKTLHDYNKFELTVPKLMSSSGIVPQFIGYMSLAWQCCLIWKWIKGFTSDPLTCGPDFWGCRSLCCVVCTWIRL